MQGSLGEKINQGGTSDVHAWAPGQVGKLFRDGFPKGIVRQEARITQTVFAAGAPAPEVFGEVTVDGRFGIVLGRLDGPTLLGATRDGAVSFEQAGAIMAALALAVHSLPPPPESVDVRAWMDAAFRRPSDTTPKPLAAAVLARIETLRQPWDGLCHGDLHPGNVILTSDGPRLVDWTFAVRAPPALDHGLIHITLTELALDVADNPRRPVAVNAAAQAEYARLSGQPVEALRGAMEAWLPVAIVRYFLLLGEPKTERWRGLMQRAEAALRAPD